MPVSIQEINGRFRIVEPDGKISKTKNGVPVDGGGHTSKSAAMAQVRAINTSDAEKTFKPPSGAAEQARKAIEWKEKYGDEVKGGTQVGWTRARQLVNREELSASIVKRMHSFFSRHEGNQTVSPENKNEPWKDNGYVAWLIWGGDAGKTWAARIAKQIDEG